MAELAPFVPRHADPLFTAPPDPGRRRLLFVALSESSHTHSWIELLRDSDWEVRLFAPPTAPVADHVELPCYVAHPPTDDCRRDRRCYLHPTPAQYRQANELSDAARQEFADAKARLAELREQQRMYDAAILDYYGPVDEIEALPTFRRWRRKLDRKLRNWGHPPSELPPPPEVDPAALPEPELPDVLPEDLTHPAAANEIVWLHEVIQHWQPHVVHSLGFDPASYLVGDMCRLIGRDQGPWRWLATARGGPELHLKHRLPDYRERIVNVLRHCDRFLADNEANYQVARELGLAPEKAAGRTFPGTGGLDLAQGAEARRTPPSRRRRLLVYPKAYESPASKALPVFEALRLAWDRIQPCEWVGTASGTEEMRMWFAHLPTPVREGGELRGRIPRDELLALLAEARVLLIPSLSDGIPNSLYEGICYGAFPIVSPIPTLEGLVQDPANACCARNLYPEELAEAIVRAMTDDALVDAAAEANLSLLARLADRDRLRDELLALYEAEYQAAAATGEGG